MELSKNLFWGCIAILLAASVFYGYGAVRMRGSTVKAEGKLENGSIVMLSKVIDGDTVVLASEGQSAAAVRILGIKSFDAGVEKDVVATYGRAAVDTLERVLKDRPVRVMLHSTPKDKYGRYIATLYVDQLDVGLHLVKEGLALVYPVYPFPAMSFYLQEQELARAARRGLWASTEVATRALGLLREWQKGGG
ncbi:MAG: thermonuclease family protein [Syntrophobacteraceae bacterium]|nr:thermonuclease family protein [Syntrophobacteraceae bacterium]